MNDTATPAPAAPDAAPAPQPVQQSVPIDNSGARAPNPAERSSPAQPQQKEMPLERVPIDEAIRRADAKATERREQKEAAEKAAKAPEPKAEAKPPKEAEPKAERPRAEDGKFASTKPAEAPTQQEQPAQPQPREPVKEPAPSRWSTEAKATWETIDPIARQAILKREVEVEAGFEKYRPYRELDSYVERAEKSGTTLKAALESYTGIEDMLRQNPLAGLDRICRNIGTTLQQVAEHVMGQPPEQKEAQKDHMIQQLYAEIAELKKDTSTVKETIERQQTDSVLRVIEDFKTKPEHARFDELENDITMFLETGRAKNLQEAYQLAERLNPAPDAPQEKVASEPPFNSASQPTPFNSAGTKSISGAPATGSNPEGRKKKGPPPSIDESLKRAEARVGSR